MKGHAEMIKEKLSIVDVIGSYIRLQPSGQNYKACCPFHMEKTPSFSVTPDKGMFYCYGCQKGGDMFTFVQEIEKITFREALEKLARDAGVDIHDGHTPSPGNTKKLYDIMSMSARFYHSCLRLAPEVINYLESRGLSRETIKSFSIGYSPGFSEVITLLSKKFSNNDIIASGTGIMGNRGLFDRFARRVTFPILDHQGRVVGFTARILPGDPKEGSTGKYINSPETDIYHKSKVLFGYYQAKKSILEKKHVVIVEGNMDVIMLHQAGHTQSVGVSGTACTPTHIELIARLTDEVVLAYDQDSAGQSALHKTALLAINRGLNVSVVHYTEKDPADIIAKDPSLWEQYIHQRISYLDSIIHHVLHINDSQKRLSLVKEIIFPAIAANPSKTSQDAQLVYVASKLALSLDSLQYDFKSFIQNTNTYTREPEHTHGNEYNTTPKKDIIMELWEQLLIVKDLYASEIPEIVTYYNTLTNDFNDLRMVTIALDPVLRATISAQTNTLDIKQKNNLFQNMCQSIEILLIEKQYHQIMQQLRVVENDISMDSSYAQKLKESNDLLVRLHMLKQHMQT
jgi:DNA primase